MEKNFQLTPDHMTSGSITVHPEILQELKIIDSKKMQIQYGSSFYPVMVLTSSELSKNVARLSTDMIKMLDIPMNCQFEMYQMDNTFRIGPYIGLLASFKEQGVIARLNRLLDYLYYYREIKGSIIVFSLDKVDCNRHTVEGFRYNPERDDWDKGTYPYPSAIFINTGTVSSNWIRHFQSVIGDCVFNDFYLNKWDIHKILESSEVVNPFLPESILYADPNDIYSFMKKHRSLIIKSINASKGSAIYKIESNGDKLDILYPKTEVTYKLKRKEAKAFFKSHFVEDKFMIQENLTLLTYQDRTIDFRVILLKNGQRQWQVMGMFARHGQPGNILSNISPLVKVGEETLKEVLKLDSSEVLLLIQKINQISIKAVKEIEKTGVHFANTGVDISIDQDQNIRIIEIQHCNPSHDIALEAGLPELYYEILKANMLYAKKLAEFD